MAISFVVADIYIICAAAFMHLIIGIISIGSLCVYSGAFLVECMALLVWKKFCLKIMLCCFGDIWYNMYIKERGNLPLIVELGG